MSRGRLDEIGEKGADEAAQIVKKFQRLGIKNIFFDFDGTLTNRHTFANKLQIENFDLDRPGHLNVEEWFADSGLLKAILAKCKESKILVTIVSHQDDDLIKKMLELAGIEVGVDKDITAVYGCDYQYDRGAAIKIQASEDARVLYIDDNPLSDDYLNEFVITPRGILDVWTS